MTWHVLRPLLSKVNDKSNVHQEFLVENRFIAESKVIADKFCQYFTSVGYNLAQGMDCCNEPLLRT